MDAIKHWPENDQPREKLWNQGACHLSNAELIAIMLRSGTRGNTAIDIAHSLLNEYGSLRHLFSSPLTQLCRHPGVGRTKATTLLAARELAVRLQHERAFKRDSLTSPRQCEDYLLCWLRDKPHECFVGIFLDNKNQVICCEELFRGTIDQVSVYPREVARLSLERQASAVIVAHNHPSGVAEPSQSDIAITGRLRAALELLDIRLLDHLIIGDCAAISLAERGYL